MHVVYCCTDVSVAVIHHRNETREETVASVATSPQWPELVTTSNGYNVIITIDHKVPKIGSGRVCGIFSSVMVHILHFVEKMTEDRSLLDCSAVLPAGWNGELRARREAGRRSMGCRHISGKLCDERLSPVDMYFLQKHTIHICRKIYIQL